MRELHHQMMTAAATPDGLLLVDKPAGVSSHDVVMATRAALREKRIGHAGTLDPFATGLLVMLVGRATRLLPYLPGDPKVYDAEIVFGTETDTEDHLGTVTRSAPLPTRAAIADAAARLTGTVSHVPSAFSAKRVGGRRAYAIARKGETVELDPVEIRVDSWELIGFAGTDEQVASCNVRITCSGGTYVRALARDLARAAGSAAHLRALRRLKSGPFDVNDACTLQHLRDRTMTLRPALDAIPHITREVISRDELLAIVRGVAIPAKTAGAFAALVNEENAVLVAFAERQEERWQPRVVLRPASSDLQPE